VGTRLRLLCLGPFEAYWGERQLVLRNGSKSAAILQYFAPRPGLPIRRAELRTVFWPGLDPSEADRQLDVALRALRLPATDDGERLPIVDAVGDACRLNPALSVWVDADAFAAHLDAGRRLERQGRIADAAREYAAAVDLYRGDYLVEEVWRETALLRRERLRDAYLSALAILADYSFATRDLVAGIVYCHRILAYDPCREDVYSRLMRAYADQGQPGQALLWYHRAALTLERELSTTPSPQTVALYREIRARQA
jgi:DNA-binding SARP family transcriptional activator